MIPITLKTLGTQHQRPRLSALLYGAGIVVSYCALGLVASTTGGIFGSILGNIYFTFAFSALLFVLGMSMLGWTSFAFLQRLGGKIATNKNSLLNALCLGLGAGLVAAPCTGPILGALLAYASTQLAGFEAFALFLLYSIGFACPYVFAGSLIVRLARFKVAPRLQLIVKLLIAGLIFAACFYFLRIPFYQQLRLWQEHWGVIALSLLLIALPISCLAVWRYAENKLPSLLAATLLGFSMFAFSQKITSPPLGEKVTWIKNETQALQQARERGLPLLIDAWAEWCERCKQMDAYTYNEADVSSHLQQHWVALKLDFTLNSAENDALRQRYGILSLPTTILLPPSLSLEEKATFTGFLNAETLLAHLRALQAKN